MLVCALARPGRFLGLARQSAIASRHRHESNKDIGHLPPTEKYHPVHLFRTNAPQP